MGSSGSVIMDAQGRPVTKRRCILLVTPPSYQVSRLVSELPSVLGFEFVSIGQMIRDEINKKTNYSRIILQNLQQFHKINEKILDILLKNAVLLGDFIVKFSPRDKEEFYIWRKFVEKVRVEVAVVIRVEPDQAVMKRQSFREKFKAYEIEVEQIKDLVSKQRLLIVNAGQNAAEKIVQRLKMGSSEKVE